MGETIKQLIGPECERCGL